MSQQASSMVVTCCALLKSKCFTLNCSDPSARVIQSTAQKVVSLRISQRHTLPQAGAESLLQFLFARVVSNPRGIPCCLIRTYLAVFGAYITASKHDNESILRCIAKRSCLRAAFACNEAYSTDTCHGVALMSN